MKKRIDRKGFTLIELLAVIVILAIIILIAMPNVLSAMEKSRVNAFATEANSIIKYAGTAYSDLTMAGKINSSTVCIDVQRLGSQAVASNAAGSITVEAGQNFLSKDLSKYKGYVEIKIAADGSVTYTSNIYNGTYKIEGKSGNEVVSTDVSEGDFTAPASEKCSVAANIPAW